MSFVPPVTDFSTARSAGPPPGVSAVVAVRRMWVMVMMMKRMKRMMMVMMHMMNDEKMTVN